MLNSDCLFKKIKSNHNTTKTQHFGVDDPFTQTAQRTVHGYSSPNKYEDGSHRQLDVSLVSQWKKIVNNANSWNPLSCFLLAAIKCKKGMLRSTDQSCCLLAASHSYDI